MSVDTCVTQRPVMSTKACAFSIAALVGDDTASDKDDVISDSSDVDSTTCLSPIGEWIGTPDRETDEATEGF